MAEPLVVRLDIEREFHAQPEELFRAWTEAESLRNWFQPAGARARRVELDPREGGRFELEFPAATGTGLVVAGRYRELAQRRLVLDFHPRWSGALSGRASLVTVDLVPRAGATTLVLRHEGLDPSDREVLALGWQQCFSRLAISFREVLDEFYARLEEYPRFRSRFGGTWPDLSDARAQLAGKRALGWLDDEDVRLFEHWITHGYVVLEGAVPAELIDRYQAELAEAWRTGHPHTEIEVYEGGVRHFVPMSARYRDQPHKVLDHHVHSFLAREIQFVPRTARFLAQLFERPPMAFQSLGFRWGTEQPMHQDTAYVVLRSPMELVGSWVALEDIQPGTGELQYYVGSHRIPEFVWFERSRAKPYELDDDREFLRWVSEHSERLGCPLVPFRPKKGDVLLWHADLVHGGSKRLRPGATRQSLVTHYCPVNVDPEFLERSPDQTKHEHRPGCFYCSQRK
jgi:uncharacterized protein YndB with AHSA1/START domain/ectoine hydroxylase-related dioxygenase (phytanoyl-CoA dioxygenase family)